MRERAKEREAASLFGRASAFQRDGRLGEAIEAYERVLELDEDLAEAHNNLGVALQALGRWEQALAHYDRAIELSPSSANAYDNRGSAMQQQGAYLEAIAFHERAIALDPNLPQAYHNLGNALLKLRRPQEAKAALLRALDLEPDFKEALNALGAAQQAMGAYDEAIAAYRKAVAVAPDYAEAYCNLGNALKESGELEQARTAYQRAADLEPRSGRFHRLLVETGVGRVEEAHLREMTALAREIDALTLDDRIQLHFALAKAYDGFGDYERAFENLREANALARSVIRYDEAKTLRAFETFPKMFTKGLIQIMAGYGDPSATPVFIFGMPRSGTTLVEQILAAHPKVYAGGELGAYADEELGAFEASLRNFTRIDVDPKNVSAFLEALAEQLRDVGARYARSVESLAPSAARVTDKWPWNFKFAGIIRLALPNARMIHVQRDPLDTCFSCYATLFSGNLPYMYDLAELGRYYRAYQRLITYWRDALPPGAMLEMQYEELVADFEPHARRLVEHCGLEWDDACKDFWSVKRPVRTASSVAVRQPLYRSAVGRAQAYHEYLGPLREALSR